MQIPPSQAVSLQRPYRQPCIYTYTYLIHTVNQISAACRYHPFRQYLYNAHIGNHAYIHILTLYTQLTKEAPHADTTLSGSIIVQRPYRQPCIYTYTYRIHTVNQISAASRYHPFRQYYLTALI